MLVVALVMWSRNGVCGRCVCVQVVKGMTSSSSYLLATYWQVGVKSLGGPAPQRAAGLLVWMMIWSIPAVRSIAVVCKVAISCCPSVLRTMSSPLESGA